jgi:hypothetical protein
MLNSAVFFTAAASALVAGVSWLLTFTPWTQFMSSGYFAPFFFLMFPLFGWGVFVSSVWRPGRNRRQVTDLLDEFPRRIRVAFGIIAAAVFVTFLLAKSSLPGQPEYEPGSLRYVYDEHGVLVPTTHAAYLHAVAVQNPPVPRLHNALYLGCRGRHVARAEPAPRSCHAGGLAAARPTPTEDPAARCGARGCGGRRLGWNDRQRGADLRSHQRVQR